MARLNEAPPVSLDTIDTLRKKMLRQNRDLAKSNSIRALRIREVENELGFVLSENLQLRTRIIELEKEAEDNDARRIAHHAMAIKTKLEAQLVEWATLVGGLGLEPPMKRHSPRMGRQSTAKRLSFTACRLSPSQRRLREVARGIEELGHIPETKSYPRKSMNHEQILALQSEANDVESPVLEPPPMCKYLVEDLVEGDSPSKYSSQDDSMILSKLDPSMALDSPVPDEVALPPLPEPQEEMPSSPLSPQNKAAREPQPPMTDFQAKAGLKRKLASRDDSISLPKQRTDENEPSSTLVGRHALREKGGDRTLKEVRDRRGATLKARKPLAVKSTNNDVAPPKRESQLVVENGVSALKANVSKTQAAKDKSKLENKSPPISINSIPVLATGPPSVTELMSPVAEATLSSSISPKQPSTVKSHVSDTPPPADISSSGETSRPSRRNRAAVSYAEPNLRNKMRRPTKELLDAVTGEGRYSRRSSQAELTVLDPIKIKEETDVSHCWKDLPLPSKKDAGELEAGGTAASPLASKNFSLQELPSTVVTERRRKPSAMTPTPSDSACNSGEKGPVSSVDGGVEANGGGSGEADVYEFMSSSPDTDREEPVERNKTSRRQSTKLRRQSTALEGASGTGARDRGGRRRSMMV
ncbi:hypothetical protein CDD81_2424 [Ophiocordyceps australis]|uniref:Shugoshin C-terminal domain-containing protein n=1 Tax=Ophiocordyceps australis TaxID=1399860 RepID=A0A2C5XYU7_9HYPO|nr:hypothetical protein CDD81_2424 [Ophiocordyceps australis]